MFTFLIIAQLWDNFTLKWNKLCLTPDYDVAGGYSHMISCYNYPCQLYTSKVAGEASGKVTRHAVWVPLAFMFSCLCHTLQWAFLNSHGTTFFTIQSSCTCMTPCLPLVWSSPSYTGPPPWHSYAPYLEVSLFPT